MCSKQKQIHCYNHACRKAHRVYGWDLSCASGLGFHLTQKKVTWTAGCYFRISKYEACGIKTGHIHWRESMHLCIYNFYPFILSNGLVSVMFILSYEFVNISWNGGILICYKMLHSGTNKQTRKKARNNHTHFYENKTELFRKRSAKWKNVNVFFCVVLWAEKMETFKNDDVFLVMWSRQVNRQQAVE